MYEGYDANSSRKAAPIIGMSMNKPSFKLNMAGITGDPPKALNLDEDTGDKEETITG